MKQFLKDYGFAILSAIVVIALLAMSSPIGVTIKSEVSNIANSFAAVVDNKFNENSSANPYRNMVLSVQRLYDVGEQNLTEDDIVYVNGVGCYVLEVSPDNSKAKLITKDIYDVRFDTGGHISEEVEGHIGEGYFPTYTFDYKYSSLNSWIINFYKNTMREEEILKNSSVDYYFRLGHSYNLDDYNHETLLSVPIYSLDAKEAKQYASKFSWVNNQDYNCGFWTTAGFKNGDFLGAWYIKNNGTFTYVSNVGDLSIGARPVFWLSLE